ncbi:hypothetical protein [Iningainema tapete]|uniref:Uncharacterized protein n=1 Tax=Iningainema tapete BLCC-T55 TaxID=2748662 RepID=A0A8J7BWS9_9CYAN|nr:hypothetical protein [Iningainema tapete]MBD2771498.1 hypothetical protein [Iningainema tapete BLCC-T55]
MEANTEISLYTEVTAEESALVSGGQSTVNFDLNTYLFVIGAGAVFNGGVTTNVVNQAFNRALFTSSGAAAPAAPAAPVLINIPVRV